MLANGCAGCHTISGVPSAQGKVGPPLDSSLSQKVYLAGNVPNNLENMIDWLRFSRRIDPHTAMPSTGISEQEARDVAAYLYALR
jgi:mono/diheme cytochrome c family protein